MRHTYAQQSRHCKTSLTEESVSTELRQVRLGGALGQQGAVDAGLLDARDVVNLDARHVLHRDHVRGR